MIGTYFGLNSFDEETGNFKRYTSEDGLVNNTICGILEDQSGNLWISTTGGLSKFNPMNRIFINYDIRNSLQSDEFIEKAYFKNKNGQLFFGGVNGLHSFYPDDIEINTNPMNALITGFIVDGSYIYTDKPIEDVDKVELLYDNNSFTIDFAALD